MSDSSQLLTVVFFSMSHSYFNLDSCSSIMQNLISCRTLQDAGPTVRCVFGLQSVCLSRKWSVHVLMCESECELVLRESL